MASGKPITKVSLYWCAIKPLAMVMAILTGIVFLIGVIAHVHTLLTTPERFTNLGEIYATAFGVLLFLYFFPVAICSPMALRGIMQISEQEKVLGFSFREEMMGRKLRGIDYNDNRWFIYVTMTRIIALRNDYIRRSPVSDIRRNDWRGRTYYMMLETVDGKELKIVGDQHPLRLLKQWLAEPRHITNEEEEAIWDEYE